MTTKYSPLAQHLAAQDGDEVTLSFAAIEALLGASLPPSARKRSWWQLSNASHVAAWQQVGWRVKTANLAWRTVTFARRPSGRTEAWRPPST